MGARSARVRALAIMGLVSVITFAAVGAHAAITVRGDAAAWKELYAAFQKLAALSSYRATIRSSATTSTVIEVARPGSYHSVTRMIIDGNVRTIEHMNVNGQIRERTTDVPGVPAEWQCSTGAAPDLGDPFGDPFEAIAPNGTVDVSRGPDTLIDGTPVRTYQYVLTQTASGQTMRGKDTIYVDKANGLPRRVISADADGELTAITDYDYGGNIVIALPPCKQS